MKTDWAHAATQQLSQQLDQTVQALAQGPGAEVLDQRQGEMEQLGDRIQTIVQQDQQRRTTAPEQIWQAATTVQQARQQICQQLQSLKLFQAGQPDGVLREAQCDPSAHIVTARSHLTALKVSLDAGDEGRSQTHLDTIATETQTAHKIVTATQTAVNAYPRRLSALKQQILHLHQHRQTTTIPLLKTIEQTYAPEVLPQVAAEVKAGTTIANNPQLAANLMQTATDRLKTAVGAMNQAEILAADQGLDDGERLLESAKFQLNCVAEARDALEQRQHTVLKERDVLAARIQQTAVNLHAAYVRSTTQTLEQDLRQHLDRVSHQIQQQPLNPYQATTLLQSVEQQRQKVEAAIATDQRDYQTAKTTIQRAESALSRAQQEVSTAQNERFRYATVSTMTADACLRNGRSLVSQATRSLHDQHYEASMGQAKEAIAEAQRATREIQTAVSRARRRHNAEQRRRNAESRAESSLSFSHGASLSSSSSSESRSSSSRNSLPSFSGWSSSLASRSTSRSARRSSSRPSRSSSKRSSNSGSRGGSW